MFHEILDKQRAFFRSGATLSKTFRCEMLTKLYRAIKESEGEILAALTADLGKSGTEGFMCEVGLSLSEISHMKRHLGSYMKPVRVATPLTHFPSRSYRLPSPRGNVLIMSPWNYPFLLTISPLIDAIAAGCTAVVKPSAYSPHTSRVVADLLTRIFPREYVAVVTGGRAENAALLDEAFDLIFFTGSPAVGREVLKKSSDRLTPCILELGGKSPCIVDETANIPLAARRIVWGKFLNCGQTCVAPDYILCDKKIASTLADALVQEVTRQFGAKPLENPDYGKIISPRHFERLVKLIDPAKVCHGGASDAATCRLEPTILQNVTWSDAVMQEEIFGPILPIVTYDAFEEIEPLLADKPKPLALYLFSSDKRRIRETMAKVSFGGGCVNDVVVHLATSEMPFGGVGESGMGTYHGKEGFLAFSHLKSIVDKKTWLDLPMRYQPFNNALYKKLLKLFLR